MVFSNRKVVELVNQDFIPVAVKAGHVANPGDDAEGKLLQRLRETQPAPQGIAVLNSDGDVLVWALRFEDDAEVLGFFAYAKKRFAEHPDGSQKVATQRFMIYPTQSLDEIQGATASRGAPDEHVAGEPCPYSPGYEQETVVGKIVGRRLDQTGTFVGDTIGQENYMEATVEIPVDLQVRLVEAVVRAEGKAFRLPADLERTFVANAFMGVLDVNPLAFGVERQEWDFSARAEDAGEDGTIWLVVHGTSDVSSHDSDRDRATDGRRWSNAVKLTWKGLIQIHGERILEVRMYAQGRQKLEWGSRRFDMSAPAVRRLPAGHHVDMDADVRFGLTAGPVTEELTVGEHDLHRLRRGSQSRAMQDQDPPPHIRRKLGRLQAALQDRARDVRTPREVARIMQRFSSLMQAGKFDEAEKLLDEALELISG